MSTKTSVPFPPETKPPTTTTDLIAEARLTLRRRWEAARAAQRAETRTDAERAYEKHLTAERDQWIKTWIADNAADLGPYPYADLSDSDAVRVSLDQNSRLEKLIEAGMWDAAIQVHIYRLGGKTSLSNLKAWLTSVGFSPVDGTETITKTVSSRPREIIHAENISRELKSLLRQASLTVEHQQV
jgi:hypothetical protein